MPRFLLLLMLVLPLAAPAGAARAADAAPRAAAAYFTRAAFAGALLSPSGRYLAAKLATGGRDRLVVIDLQTQAVTPVAGFANVDIFHVQWVNDQRLLYDTTDRQLGEGELNAAPGLYAVNRDGSGARQLAARRGGAADGRKMLPWHTYMLPGQGGARDSDDVYVLDAHVDQLSQQITDLGLLRLNTVTGRAQPVPRPGPVQHWLLDAQGAPRLATTREAGTTTVHYRDPATDAWRVLASFASLTPGFTPVGFAPDGSLYVNARHGADTSALYRLDLASGQLAGTPLVRTEGYDFRGALVTDATRLLGVRYATDAASTVWLDPALAALQARVDAARPGTLNHISVPARPDAPWVLVHSEADRVPPSWSLFDLRSGQFAAVGSSYPQLAAAPLAQQEVVRYGARDGLPIPAVLTRPAGSAGRPVPLVVLVHGGPWVPAPLWGWDSARQFLAAQGYAVLEPAFRGTLGLGARHFEASFKQWGRAMQDDLADGVRWAERQGIAAPGRACLLGASYGGYATLMGLIRDPDLFRCGVAAAAPVDIELMYKGTWLASDDIADEAKQFTMPVLIGDPVKDAALLRAASPLAQAARLTRPLLLAYGGADRRVPLYHGERLAAALRAAGQPPEWLLYEDEGHGWRLEAHQIDYWDKVAAFLARHLGPTQP